MKRVKTISLPINGKEITISAPTVGIVMNASDKYKNEVAQGAFVAAACCNITEAELKEYDIADFQAIQEVVSGFLETAKA